MAETRKARILVVEDEAIVALDIRHRLQALGYDIAGVVASGGEAVKLVEETRPDLVMMDIVLKGDTSGTEAATEIHRRWKTPVIFLTAFADPQTLEKAKTAEPYGYIPKPFDDTDLRIGVEIALHKAEADAEKNRLIDELNRAMLEIKHLSGLIPICASCKKIRDDHGYWQSVERYISEHSEAQFTHGICPECVVKLYPDL